VSLKNEMCLQKNASPCRENAQTQKNESIASAENAEALSKTMPVSRRV
jgi:hypothetical protein